MLPAALFATLGGYDERVSNGEDHLLVWAAHRARNPVLPVGADLWTSADNYAHHGWLATTARHLGLTLVQALPQAWLRLTGR